MKSSNRGEAFGIPSEAINNVRSPSAFVIKKKKMNRNQKDNIFFLMIVSTDVDECFQGTHSCSVYAVCSNTKGSYDCRCKTGYIGDGQNCTWLGKNPLIPSLLGPTSYNEIDVAIPSYRESKYEDADRDGNGVDNKSMKRKTLKIVGMISITMTLGRLH